MTKTRTEILEEKKVKITANRELVLDVFLNHQYALSLADLEEILPWGDRATHFRTLKTFEQHGIIHQIKDGSNSTKYALCQDSCGSSQHLDIHPHFHCQKCGKTICLEKQEIQINNLPHGVQVNEYSLIIGGFCADCILLVKE